MNHDIIKINKKVKIEKSKPLKKKGRKKTKLKNCSFENLSLDPYFFEDEDLSTDNKNNKYKIKPSIKHLILNGNEYCHQIDFSILPLSITHLTIHMNRHAVIEILPKNIIHVPITHLTIGKDIGDHEIFRIFSELICITMPGRENITYLPTNIEEIVFFDLCVVQTNLPINLKIIKLIKSENKLICLPKIPYECKIIDEKNNLIYIEN